MQNQFNYFDMQTFIRLPSGKTIAVDFNNGFSTVDDIKHRIVDKEKYPDYLVKHMVLQTFDHKVFDNNHILTRARFGDVTFVLLLML